MPLSPAALEVIRGTAEPTPADLLHIKARHSLHYDTVVVNEQCDCVFCTIMWVCGLQTEILKFCGSGLLPDRDVLLIALAACGDDHHAIVTAAEELVKRTLANTTVLEDAALVKRCFALLLGSLSNAAVREFARCLVDWLSGYPA